MTPDWKAFPAPEVCLKGPITGEANSWMVHEPMNQPPWYFPTFTPTLTEGNTDFREPN